MTCKYPEAVSAYLMDAVHSGTHRMKDGVVRDNNSFTHSLASNFYRYHRLQIDTVVCTANLNAINCLQKSEMGKRRFRFFGTNHLEFLKIFFLFSFFVDVSGDSSGSEMLIIQPLLLCPLIVPSNSHQKLDVSVTEFRKHGSTRKTLFSLN